MIAGHQRLISPFLTRDHEAGIYYGSICSIYPVRFAGSGTAVALLTHDHEPSTMVTQDVGYKPPSQGPFISHIFTMPLHHAGQVAVHRGSFDPMAPWRHWQDLRHAR
jgi:hypothetical protein